MSKLIILFSIIRLFFCGFLSERLYEKIKDNKYYKVAKPSESPFAGYTDEQLAGMISFGKLPKRNPFASKVTKTKGSYLPKEYDVRKRYPECEVYIKQQDKCESSLTFAAVSSISYRHCMVTGENVELSPQNIISCDYRYNRCRLGELPRIFDYLWDEGVVTEKCFPFVSGNRTDFPDCPNECSTKGLKLIKYYAKRNSSKSLNNLKEIKNEIYRSGPIIVGMLLYDSLYLYKEGLYVQGGKELGWHALTALGWGIDEETGKEYLICQNSWGKDWGMNGFVKFDVDSCLISFYGYSAEAKGYDK